MRSASSARWLQRARTRARSRSRVRGRGRGRGPARAPPRRARAARQHEHAVAEEQRLLDVVGDEQAVRGSSASAASSHSCISARVIESSERERLVEQQHRLAGEQRAHERDALAHPARQLVRPRAARSRRARSARTAARRAPARLGARRALRARARARRCRAPSATAAAGRAAASGRTGEPLARATCPRRDRRLGSSRPRSARAASTCRSRTGPRCPSASPAARPRT